MDSVRPCPNLQARLSRRASLEKRIDSNFAFECKEQQAVVKRRTGEDGEVRSGMSRDLVVDRRVPKRPGMDKDYFLLWTKHSPIGTGYDKFAVLWTPSRATAARQ